MLFRSERLGDLAVADAVDEVPQHLGLAQRQVDAAGVAEREQHDRIVGQPRGVRPHQLDACEPAVRIRDESLPRETYRPGDRVRAYVYDVRREQRGPQIFLSRTHPEFMARLFGQEVPEIYDGVVEVVAVARDPGSRAKIEIGRAHV